MQLSTLGVLVVAGFLSYGVQAQQAKNVPTTNVIDAAKEVKEGVVLLGLTKEYIVTGDTAADTYFIGAETIKFNPGARLVFTSNALKTRRNLVIAAKTIEMVDPTKPGTITWDQGISPSEAAPQSGQAASGAHGSGDGASGARGVDGAVGNKGLKGEDAPNLTIFAMSFKGAPPIIELRGEAGGRGGTGQQGGDGGVGRQGSPASAGPFDCKRGAGHGGNGGRGGDGGQGGIGGTGGAGGTVTLVSLPSAFPAMLTLVRVDVSGGDSGAGGEGGLPGKGGTPGRQGAKALPYCKDEPGRAGKGLGSGDPGRRGDKGEPGIQGDLFYTTLTEDNFKNLFGIQK